MDEHIDGLIFSPIFHIRVGESQHEVDVILSLIDYYKIEKFVEVGIHIGGLTEIIINNTACRYLGLEINEGFPDNRVKELLINVGGIILYGDCMSDSAYDMVKRFVENGRTLIYCDNGNKPLEIKRYHSLCKSGDILLTHDFTDGTRVVRDLPYHYYDKREVTVEDIEFLETDKTFQRLPEDVFKETRNIGWIKL